MSRHLSMIALIVMFSAACKRKDAVDGTSEDERKAALAGSTSEAAPKATAAVSSRPSLPPEPPPLLAGKTSDVPALEVELAKDPAYQGIWQRPWGNLNPFLSHLSQQIATGGEQEALGKILEAKRLRNASVILYEIFARANKFPDDFTAKFLTHLSSVKSELHAGVWSASSKENPTWHDYSCLAAWSLPEDATMLREHIAAKTAGAGPTGWSVWVGDKGPAPRPWLVDEGAALDRLALITKLTAEEAARAVFLKEEAKKPRQPELGEEFKLGDYTYIVKSVNVVDTVGTGFAAKRADEGAAFVLVLYSIRNDTSATEAVLTDDFRIVDAQGREFRPSTEAITALAMSGDKDLGIAQLQPGLKKSMTAAFQMPEEATRGIFTLVIPEKGLRGSKKSVRMTLK
ncbi:MAG TPA: DUF4352 domain-containing protein [Kofleriaceae bacterium]|nr:DUF4352 domain-containing protein [Kofleriaceae bacterium]